MVKRRAAYGFTLLEMMVVLAIIGIIALVTPRLVAQLFTFYQIHNTRIEVERDARASLDILNRFIRQGIATSVVIDQAAGQPPFTRITFQTLSGQQIQFYEQGNQLLQYNVTTAQGSLLTKNLAYLAFTYSQSDDPTLISITMTVSKLAFKKDNPVLQLATENVRVMN